MMSTILVADDDSALRETLSTLLVASGYEVESVSTGAEALSRWPRIRPDLLIADLHMPDGGLRLVEQVSRNGSIPVIVLSADDQESVKVAALDAGAEDYVTKPFSAAELLARVRVALRRRPPANEPLTVGRLTLTEANLSATVGSDSVSLTPTEFDLLQVMATGNGFVATADLLASVWGPAYRTEHEYVRIYVRRLRAKLDRLGLSDAIESRPGLGYRLREP